MKSPQARMNAKATKQAMKADAIELALFFGKGLIFLAVCVALLSAFDVTVDLSKSLADEIIEAAPEK